jgi:myo-inositol-1(or 4)-monophosphatase
MDASQLDECYDYVLNVIIKCGEIMRAGSRSMGVVEMKDNYWDWVTEVDRRIEQVFIEEIAKKYPGHKIIGEETTADTKVKPVLTATPTWIIDPIDGTTNFIRGIKHSCISVALVVDKELTFGFVFNPLQNELYAARKGKGAHLNGDPIRVSKVEKVSLTFILFFWHF